MDTLLFIIALATAGLGLAWYVLNESSGAKGERGILALRDLDKGAPKGPAWRRKKRIAASRLTGETSALETLKEAASNSDPAFRPTDESAAHQMKTKNAYKTSGPLPRFGERSAKGPTE